MRRSAKLSLYGLAVLGVVAGTLTAVGTDRAVAVSVDGHRRTVHTSAATVGGVLHDAKLAVGAHDVLAPASEARVHKGETIEVRRGRLLRLSVDGQTRDIWTTATTVDQALADLGYGDGRLLGVSRGHRLPLSPTQLTLIMPKRLTILADHKRIVVVSDAPTVRDAVDGAHLGLVSTDRLAPAADQRPTAGMTITLTRVRLRTTTGIASVPYRTQSTKDPGQYRGTTEIVRPGKAGRARVTYQLVYINGKLSQRKVVTSTVLRAPVARVQKVGTKAITGNTPAEARAIGKQLVSARGWDDSQYQCLVSLWNKESGWRVGAANPSGAYGIPQALPGSKMASSGPNWQSNARTQITWGLGYIAARYSTPCGAWSHSQATNWY